MRVRVCVCDVLYFGKLVIFWVIVWYFVVFFVIVSVKTERFLFRFGVHKRFNIVCFSRLLCVYFAFTLRINAICKADFQTHLIFTLLFCFARQGGLDAVMVLLLFYGHL